MATTLARARGGLLGTWRRCLRAGVAAGAERAGFPGGRPRHPAGSDLGPIRGESSLGVAERLQVLGGPTAGGGRGVEGGEGAELRLLRVGLIGAPNAGKSLLTNVLLGRKVTAVSNKVNTTTSQTFGVLTEDGGEGDGESTAGDERPRAKSETRTRLMIFDTPGVVDHKHYR